MRLGQQRLRPADGDGDGVGHERVDDGAEARVGGAELGAARSGWDTSRRGCPGRERA